MAVLFFVCIFWLAGPHRVAEADQEIDGENDGPLLNNGQQTGRSVLVVNP